MELNGCCVDLITAIITVSTDVEQNLGTLNGLHGTVVIVRSHTDSIFSALQYQYNGLTTLCKSKGHISTKVL